MAHRDAREPLREERERILARLAALEREVELVVQVLASGSASATAQDAQSGRPLGGVAAGAVRIANGMRFSPAEEDELVVRLSLRPRRAE